MFTVNILKENVDYSHFWLHQIQVGKFLPVRFDTDAPVDFGNCFTEVLLLSIKLDGGIVRWFSLTFVVYLVFGFSICFLIVYSKLLALSQLKNQLVFIWFLPSHLFSRTFFSTCRKSSIFLKWRISVASFYNL